MIEEILVVEIPFNEMPARDSNCVPIHVAGDDVDLQIVAVEIRIANAVAQFNFAQVWRMAGR